MPIERQDLTQFGNLEWLAKQVVEGFITGMHKSPFHGFSVEFAEHRLYNTGESTRHIDWKLYARTDKMFIKRYEEETNLRCQFVLDTSSSMYFEHDGLSKMNFAVHSIASLMELMKRQRDAVGLSLFDEDIRSHTPAKSSQRHIHMLYAQLEELLAQNGTNAPSKTELIQSLHEIAERSHRRSMVVIFTDLLDDPSRADELFEALNHLKHNKHEVVLFHVFSKEMEEEFKLKNRPYTLVDMETGEKMRLHPNEIRADYTERIKKYFREIELRCASFKIDFMRADIAEGYDAILLQYLLKREKMR